MKLPEFGKPLPANEKRLILGGPTLQLFPLRYQWMWQAFLDSQANHWLPTEIQMGADRYHYSHKLTDEERWMFDWALSMLTTQDLNVLGNLEEGIERHLTVPEASMYLGRQTDEESIHTWSYQLIVEALALDETTVYERFLRERSLFDKVEFAYRYHRDLLELRMDDHQSFAAIGRFIEALAFWAIVMEGGWFYVGFTWIYALARRGLMPGSTEMFQYIQRDEAGHMNFWIGVINELIREYPEAYTSHVQNRISDMVLEATALEERYARDVCTNVLGISTDDYMQHFRHRMNLNLSKIGIAAPFIPSVSQPLIWAGEFEKLKEKNFFETRVTEYRKGGTLEFDGTNEDQFGSVMPPPPTEGDTPDDLL